ncbi:MAG TPA: hypothetical protein VFB06_11635 [Streptosporangiaceae bacterium]|nr:hypothetical protein [Streptosporangiaceae bacterium]
MQPENETVPVRKDDLDMLVAACTSYLPADTGPEVLAAFGRVAEAFDGAHGIGEEPEQASPPLPEGGRWLELELLGHRQRTGYVTEVTVAGAAMLHIDLPAKIFGGEPDAWEEYAPSALYGLSPIREESVRRAWEAQRRAAEERARREAEWRRMDEQRALTTGEIRQNEVRQNDGLDGDPDYDWADH